MNVGDVKRISNLDEQYIRATNKLYQTALAGHNVTNAKRNHEHAYKKYFMFFHHISTKYGLSFQQIFQDMMVFRHVPPNSPRTPPRKK